MPLSPSLAFGSASYWTWSGATWTSPPAGCASVLVALGKNPRYVMAQLGHTDPAVTLGIYAQAMTSSEDDRERLRLLVEGDDLAARMAAENCSSQV